MQRNLRSDFCAFILTHGRPDRVYTIESLRKAGYTGPLFLVVDDQDKSLPEYRSRFGDMVLTFSKDKIAERIDEADNFNDRRAIIYARNACFDLAEAIGFRYFIQLDDDYMAFNHKYDASFDYGTFPVRDLNSVLGAMVSYFEAIPATSIAMSQGGDHIGGQNSGYNKTIRTKRKAMNTFICDTHRRFEFSGRVNEDVNTYVGLGMRGALFLTLMGLEIMQRPTQTNAGGMTELYLDSGTYVKSFYSVMFAPSCVIVKNMVVGENRIHHFVKWDRCVPQILREEHRKPEECNA
jgi:hypothetical protein